MIKIILRDPVALAALVILLGGIVLLLWALKKWFELTDQETRPSATVARRPVFRKITEEPFSFEEHTAPEPAPAAPTPPAASETPDLVPQLVERLNQMTERLYLIEKKEPEGPTMDMAHKLDMIANRLMALESIVQQNTPKSGMAPFDKEISLAFKGLADRISILEKAIQAIHTQEHSSAIKREVI